VERSLAELLPLRENDPRHGRAYRVATRAADYFFTMKLPISARLKPIRVARADKTGSTELAGSLLPADSPAE